MPAASLFDLCPNLKSYTVTISELWFELDEGRHIDGETIKNQDSPSDYRQKFPKFPNGLPSPISVRNFVLDTYSRQLPELIHSYPYSASVGDNGEAKVLITCKIEYKKEKSIDEKPGYTK